MIEVASIYEALNLFLRADVLLALIVGAGLIGLGFGIIPGLGGVLAMALALPYTYGLEPVVAFAFFSAIMSSNAFAGSITAILLNTPGTPQNLTTTFDGFPMARKGEAARAIYISALSCMFGTIIGALVLLLSIPIMQKLVLLFRTPDMFWLFVFGVTMIPVASKGNVIKGISAGGLGILLSQVGLSRVFPVSRFTGGSMLLYDGVPIMAFILGIFALSTIVFLASYDTIAKPSDSTGNSTKINKRIKKEQFVQSLKDFYKYKWVASRSSLLGAFIGILPALGGGAASFMSYSVARMFSKNPGLFGAGSPEGIISSETANDAKDGGSLIPTVAFGIPGSPDTIILLSMFILYGLPVGPKLLTEHQPLLLLILISLVVGQVIVSIVGLSIAGFLAKATHLKTYYLVPCVGVIIMFGVFFHRGNVLDLLVACIIAVLAYSLKRFGFPILGFAMGFILGQNMERAFTMSMRLSRGSLDIFFERTASLVMVATIVGTLLFVALHNPKPTKGKKVEKELEIKAQANAKSKPDRSLSIFALVLAVVSAVFFVWSFYYPADMRLFPLCVSCITLALLVFIIAAEFIPYIKKILLLFSRGETLEEKTDAEEIPAHIKTIIWILVSSVMIISFGFFLVVPVAIIYYILRADSTRWRQALIIAASFWLFFFLINLYSVMPTPIWPGFIPEIIPGIIGGGILASF